MQILIAEDGAVSRTVLSRALEDSATSPSPLPTAKRPGRCTVKSGRRGCGRQRLDDARPGRPGPLREGPETHRPPGRGYPFFVLLTALSNKEHLFEGMQAGADDYLSKPLNRDEPRVRLLAAARVTALHRRLAEQRKELERLNFELFERARKDPLARLGDRPRLEDDLWRRCGLRSSVLRA